MTSFDDFNVRIHNSHDIINSLYIFLSLTTALSTHYIQKVSVLITGSIRTIKTFLHCNFTNREKLCFVQNNCTFAVDFIILLL